ncbi:MAG: cupin domain-containing protein [Leucobacter sp.]
MSEHAHFVTRQDPAAAGPFELGTLQWLREFGSADRPGLSAGYWYVTTEQAPEPFPLTAAFDETFHLLSGRLRIEFIGGETVEISAGDSISYNAGTEMRWTVLEDASKFFVYSGTGA